jgi:hypothetical protein
MEEKGGARSFPITMVFIVHKKLKESGGGGASLCVALCHLFHGCTQKEL